MGTNPVQRGATAETVSANVKRLRLERNLGLRALAKKLADVGRPSLRYTTIDQIEKGTRRVDVDDLLALAVVLKTSPATLLMPPVGWGRTEMVSATGIDKATAEQLWLYLQADAVAGGGSVVGLSPAAFAANALPLWLQGRWGIEETETDGNN